ncbi:MAG TPA: HEAT repeat domain-containing protein [Acidimicrobiales bacterium]|nr:HEAT repeat domain-containing protein [Acidimicrobiales bacterium]
MSPPPGTSRRRAVVAGHEADEVAARRLVGHPDPATRASALAALARMERLDAPALEAGRDDASPLVRRRVAILLAGRPDVSLLALLDDPDPAVVEVAAFASGERTPPEDGAVAALAALATGHPDALCREAAVAALGAIGDPAGLPAVLAATGDKATVRRRAVIALAPFDGPEVEAALARAASDRDWQVRQAAEDQT